MGQRSVKVFVNRWRDIPDHRAIRVMTHRPSKLLACETDNNNELVTVALEIDYEDRNLQDLDVDSVPPSEGFIHRIALLRDGDMVPGDEFVFHSMAGRFTVYHSAESYP